MPRVSCNFHNPELFDRALPRVCWKPTGTSFAHQMLSYAFGRRQHWGPWTVYTSWRCLKFSLLWNLLAQVIPMAIIMSKCLCC